MLVAGPFLAWRISTGPLALDFLTPYLEDALTPADRSYVVHLDTTELHWAGWKGSLDVRAVGVRVANGDGKTAAAIPALSLGLSVRALSEGMVAPRTVELRDARLRLRRTRGGLVELDVGGPETPADNGPLVARALEDLLARPDPTRPMGYLGRIRITDARITIEDDILGAAWEIEDLDIELNRDGDGIGAAGGVTIRTPQGSARLDIGGRFPTRERQLSVTAHLAAIKPMMFAGLAPGLEPLNSLDVPLSGAVSVKLARDFSIERVAFDLTGGRGRLRLPDALGATYDIHGMILKGLAIDDLKRVVLEQGEIDLGGPRIALTASLERGTRPAPAVAAPVPVVAALPVPAKGGRKSRASTKKVVAPMPPPPAPPPTPPGPEVIVSGEAVVINMPVNALSSHWPTGVAPKPRAWVIDSLRDGTVPTARFAASLRGPGLDALVLTALTGTLSVDGVSVDYLRPMPRIRNGRATITFAPDRLDIAVTDGTAQNLRITRGAIAITGVDKEDQFAVIDLDVHGSVADGLKLIDSKPLEYASSLGLKPGRAGGHAAVHLLLKMPLLVALKLDDITVAADAELRALSLSEIAFGQGLSDGTVNLKIDRKGLDATGSATMAMTPLALEWRENFLPTAPFRSRYHVKAVMDDHQRAAFGLDFPPLTPPFLTGPVKADVLATVGHDGRGVLAVDADLAPAAMAMSGLNWRKGRDNPARAGATVRFTAEGVTAVPNFSVRAGNDLDVAGKVSLTDRSALERVTFDRFRVGRTELHGTLDKRDGILALNLTGPAFDLAPVLSGDSEDEPPDAEKPPPLNVDIAVDRLWASESGYLTKATARLSRTNGSWQSGSLDATLPDGKPLAARLTPNKDNREFSLTCDDAGGVLRAFGIFDNLVGGKLQVTGTVDGSDAVKGQARIEDYRVVKAPLLARLLSVAALTGILESLTGEGIRFTNLDLPFTHADGQLDVRDAQAYGPSLGLTANGKVALGREHIDLEGTVVPAYALNSLIGNIPVVGDLLTGAKGGGIFAATYSMRGAMGEPDVTVNPLAVLAPGFLRNLFNIFDGDEEDKDTAKGKDKKSATADGKKP